MSVSSYDTGGRGKRIVVMDHVLTVEQATELRDALTRELGAPQALTPGEQQVWAAAFVAKLLSGDFPTIAASHAADAVESMRRLASGADRISMGFHQHAMLIAMARGGR